MTTFLLSPAVQRSTGVSWHLYSSNFSTLVAFTGGVLCVVYSRRLYGRTFSNDCGTRNALAVHHVAVHSLYFDDASMLRESGSCKASHVSVFYGSSCHERQFCIFI